MTICLCFLHTHLTHTHTHTIVIFNPSFVNVCLSEFYVSNTYQTRWDRMNKILGKSGLERSTGKQFHWPKGDGTMTGYERSILVRRMERGSSFLLIVLRIILHRFENTIKLLQLNIVHLIGLI